MTELARANILLVDDREENLLALEAILEPLGHRLVKVTSGVAALKELLLDDFACILLDVQMPELDGFEVATLIKQRKAPDRVDSGPNRGSDVLQPALVRVHRHVTGRGRAELVVHGRPSRRPAGGGQPPRADAPKWRHVRDRVPLQARRRRVPVAPRAGGADAEAG